MQLFSPVKYLRRLSISEKFYTIILIVTAILILELGSFWFALYTASGIRAYVGGEGLWSKAQKESLDSLLRYSTTFKQSDYDNFLSLLGVPLGDNQARLELQKPHPDLSVARQGFIAGGNDPADIGGMIFLFRHFRHISYFEQAITIWTAGDAQIETQIEIGAQIHAIIAANTNPSGTATYAKIKPLIAEAIENDSTLTPLENKFSVTLGVASREVGTLLFYATLALTTIFGLGALWVALYILKLIKEVDKAKTEFVAFVSHQLRSPLGVISLSVDLLKSFGALRSTDEKDAVESISREVRGMVSLMEAILDTSRIELGSLVVEPKAIDVMTFAHFEAGVLAQLARAKGITIQESYEPAQLTLPVDPTLLRVVLQNLLGNAIKYAPSAGEVHLSVGLAQSGSEVVIRVKNTGDGIPQAHQSNIFNKLYRAPGAVTGGEQGTGLGLYIVKSIVTEAGGRVWFESGKDSGTTFYVAFPSSGMKESRGNVRL